MVISQAPPDPSLQTQVTANGFLSKCFSTYAENTGEKIDLTHKTKSLLLAIGKDRKPSTQRRLWLLPRTCASLHKPKGENFGAEISLFAHPFTLRSKPPCVRTED